MLCALPQHKGDRFVTRLRSLVVGGDRKTPGKLVEGCFQCTDGMTHNMFPATPMWRSLPDGKSFKISPAHVRDIKQRRVAPDLSGTWRDKKGLGANMKY